MKAIATMESNGITIDVPPLHVLNDHWEALKVDLVEQIDGNFGVYDGTSFRVERFCQYLSQHGIPWPQFPHGGFQLDDDTFGDMADVYPALQPLRQLRQMLSMLHLADGFAHKVPKNRNLENMDPTG
jgi:hypothetical protein